MKTNCAICNHPKRKEIDQALIQKVVTKESFPIIAQRFNVSKDSLFNHFKKHLPKLTITVEQPEELIEKGRLLVQTLQDLITECDSIISESKTSKKPSLALQAIQTKANIILKVLDMNAKEVHSQNKKCEDCRKNQNFIIFEALEHTKKQIITENPNIETITNALTNMNKHFKSYLEDRQTF